MQHPLLFTSLAHRTDNTGGGTQEPHTIGSETMQHPLLFTSRVHRTDRLPPLTPELFTGIL